MILVVAGRPALIEFDMVLKFRLVLEVVFYREFTKISTWKKSCRSIRTVLQKHENSITFEKTLISTVSCIQLSKKSCSQKFVKPKNILIIRNTYLFLNSNSTWRKCFGKPFGPSDVLVQRHAQLLLGRHTFCATVCLFHFLRFFISLNFYWTSIQRW